MSPTSKGAGSSFLGETFEGGALDRELLDLDLSHDFKLSSESDELDELLSEELLLLSERRFGDLEDRLGFTSSSAFPDKRALAEGETSPDESDLPLGLTSVFLSVAGDESLLSLESWIVFESFFSLMLPLDFASLLES